MLCFRFQYLDIRERVHFFGTNNLHLSTMLKKEKKRALLII
jgi:hypothetical protein